MIQQPIEPMKNAFGVVGDNEVSPSCEQVVWSIDGEARRATTPSWRDGVNESSRDTSNDRNTPLLSFSDRPHELPGRLHSWLVTVHLTNEPTVLRARSNRNASKVHLKEINLALRKHAEHVCPLPIASDQLISDDNITSAHPATTGEHWRLIVDRLPVPRRSMKHGANRSTCGDLLEQLSQRAQMQR